MKDYLKGWKDEQTAEIPPIPETEEELVVIRQYVPPLEREDEEATTPLFSEAAAEPEGDDEPTTLLERNVKVLVTLQRMKTGETVDVSEDPFVLGKGSDCDYIIRENSSISRRHGEIFQKEGAWFYRDLDSLNHSFMEEQQITEDLKLEDGMKLLLSDEEFLVRIEIRK